jgi:hypothetical protein
MKGLKGRQGPGAVRGLLIGTGALAMAYAFIGALGDPDLKLGGVALFLGAVLAGHDGVLMPLVIGVGALLTRSLPLTRAALILSFVITLVALPFVLGYGHSAGNPSALPLAYGDGLALVLVTIWTPTILVLALRRRDSRREQRRHGNRQKTVRMPTTPPGRSDG